MAEGDVATADELAIVDTTAATTKKFTWASVRGAIATYLASLSQTLTSKSIDLASNTLTGTTAQFNTALSDNDFATLAGTEVLTNKTLTTPPIGGMPTFGSATAQKVVALTEGTPVAINARLGNVFTLTMSGVNRTLQAPTGTTDGQKIIIVLYASGTATGTVVGSTQGGFIFGAEVTGLTQTTNGKRDLIGAIYNSALDRWLIVAYVKNYQL